MTASVTASTVLYLGPLRVLKENIYQQDDVKQPNLSLLLMFPRLQQGAEQKEDTPKEDFSKNTKPALIVLIRFPNTSSWGKLRYSTRLSHL